MQEATCDVEAHEPTLGAPPVEPEGDEVEAEQRAREPPPFARRMGKIFADDKSGDEVQQRGNNDADPDLPQKGKLVFFCEARRDGCRGKIEEDRHPQACEKNRQQARRVGQWSAQSFIADDGPQQ